MPGGPAGNRRYHRRRIRGVHARPRRLVAPIPDALEFVDAAPLMCAGLTVYNGLRNAGFEAGRQGCRNRARRPGTPRCALRESDGRPRRRPLRQP